MYHISNHRYILRYLMNEMNNFTSKFILFTVIVIEINFSITTLSNHWTIIDCSWQNVQDYTYSSCPFDFYMMIFNIFSNSCRKNRSSWRNGGFRPSMLYILNFIKMYNWSVANIILTKRRFSGDTLRLHHHPWDAFASDVARTTIVVAEFYCCLFFLTNKKI